MNNLPVSRAREPGPGELRHFAARQFIQLTEAPSAKLQAPSHKLRHFVARHYVPLTEASSFKHLRQFVILTKDNR